MKNRVLAFLVQRQDKEFGGILYVEHKCPRVYVREVYGHPQPYCISKKRKTPEMLELKDLDEGFCNCDNFKNVDFIVGGN